MAYETLIVETRDGVATVTVNRPDKLNALSDRVMEELDAAFAALGADALGTWGRRAALVPAALALVTSAALMLGL